MNEKPTTPALERKRGSGVKFVYDILRDEILDLALPTGSPIDEVQLAERFEMSRTPIREALVRLAETRPGDILGEMSLLDSGIRFSACTTLTDCEIAVLSAEAMDDMMSKDPQLTASLIALLARKLSLRLRVVSARLSDNQK